MIDLSEQTFAQTQGDTPTLTVDGNRLDLDSDVHFWLGDEEGARVQVSWEGVENGYVSSGYRCQRCEEVYEEAREAFRHCRDEHGYAAKDAPIVRVAALVNSAAIDWTGRDLTVTISTGDPRGAFGMTVRTMDDGTRILHVPHPTSSLLHEDLTELHPGTYRIG